MATNTLSKLLKKKKLTGEEVGKLILIDMVNDHLGKPTLSKVEKDAYVDALVDNKDIRTYNDYLSLYRFLGSMILDYESTSRAYAVCALEVIRQISEIKTAENAYFIASLQPRILTRRDYEQALKEAKENVSSWTYSLYSLVAYELRKNIEAYNNKEKTPYKRYFDAYKKEQANQQAIKTYRATYDNPKKDEDLTKLVMLDKYIDIYDDAELETKGGMLFFKEDYPELLQDILANYSKLEGLEYLTKLPESEYLKEDLIDFQTAYKLDILGAKDTYDDPLLSFKGCDLISGVAVIESARWINKGNIKDGTYYYRLGGLIERHLAENVLASSEIKSSIHRAKKQLMLNAKYLQSFEYILEKMAEITGVKEILVYKKEDGSEALNAIKGMVNDLLIFRRGLMLNEGKQDELSSELKTLLNPNFTIEELKPDAEDIQHVEKIIEEAQSDGKAVMAIANYLLGVSL